MRRVEAALAGKKSWIAFHRESEVLASRAQMVRNGDPDKAAELSLEAAKLEEKAARLVPRHKRRTRSVLAVSAAALWFKARRPATARVFAREWLRRENATALEKERLREIVAKREAAPAAVG